MSAAPAENSALADVVLRPMAEADRELIYRVYADTRAEEMTLAPWSEQEKEDFLRMQFRAQHDHYQKHFPNASFDIVEKAGQPIGRLYLDRRPDELRVVDIALLADQRGQGIGGALMRRILDEAAMLGKPVRIHVERNNPAMRLYKRLGFEQIEDQGVYWLMERRAGVRE